MKKTYLAVVCLLPAVGRFFMNLLTDRKAVGSTQKILSACWRYKSSFYSFSLQLRKTEIEMSVINQHR